MGIKIDSYILQRKIYIFSPDFTKHKLSTLKYPLTRVGFLCEKNFPQMVKFLYSGSSRRTRLGSALLRVMLLNKSNKRQLSLGGA